MKKSISGSISIFQDEAAIQLEEKIKPTGTVKVEGTIGDFKQEALAALLQIPAALCGTIFGLTKDSLITMNNRFDLGGATEFAKGILADEALFQELMERLIQEGLVRQESFESAIIFFPTEKYLAQCSLIPRPQNIEEDSDNFSQITTK